MGLLHIIYWGDNMVNGNLRQTIPGYNNYTITRDGNIYNRNGKKLKQYWHKGKRYTRIYSKGKRHTLSIEKILNELKFKESYKIALFDEEIVFNFENSSYLITNFCRVYNRKTKRWIKIIYRNGTPTANLSINGRVEVVSLLKFLRSIGGKID